MIDADKVLGTYTYAEVMAMAASVISDQEVKVADVYKMLRAYAAILERPVVVGDIEPELVRLFTSGYLRGHHDTVEGNFTDVYYSDRTTYFSEDVKEILTDSDYSALESMVRGKS